MEKHGLYSLQRMLRTAVRDDTGHLEAAPLGPRQKKALERRIAENREKLREVNAQIKALKEAESKPR